MRQRFRTFLAVTSALLTAACGGASYEAKAAYAGSADAPPAPPMATDGQVTTASRSIESLSLASEREEDEDSGKLAQMEPAPARPAAAPPPPPPAQPPKKAEPSSTSGSASGVAAQQAPMLIYTAELTMAVFEVDASLARVEELGREVGGFLSRRDDRSITIRVPVERFDEAMRRLQGVGDMLHRNVTVQDVTEEFRDLDVQLKNARAIRDRLAELLAKATKVEESLAIEKELGRIAGEIDRIEGRMKFLRNRAAFSTITVVFEGRPKETLGKGPFQLPVPWLHDLGLGRLLNL